ncbi:hypothetical protein [Hymenobacter roseosalivarius]|uniref:hypothetical protein n=1 Tax=Hymenobacter roseosalivarius TaxID=89967 RepID=UPI000A01A782|nr:hypothetical protein [Hymenobacter roseosalivarius]
MKPSASLLLCYLLAAFLLPACLSLQSEEQQAEAAEKAVMAKHDELMAQMDQLYMLRQQLQRATLPDTTEAGRRRRSLLRADAAMMGWMHQYRRPADTVAHEQVMAYFATQEHKIDSVGRLMQNSIDSARLVLGTQAGNSSNSSKK